MADFTFDPSKDADAAALAPLYAVLLGPSKETPTVSLGAIPLATAQAWLRAQHARYAVGVGKRSQLLQNLDLVRRVELVGTTT